MEWNLLTAQNLAIIDRRVDISLFSPSEYEIIRRIIFASADLDYRFLVSFIYQPLEKGASALEARVPIIVDSPIIQVGISGILQRTFGNPVYCLDEIVPYFFRKANRNILLNSLTKSYPHAIYIVGQNQLALLSLLDLQAQSSFFQPSLIVASYSGFVRKELINQRLHNSPIPHIRIDGTKGGCDVAIALFSGLIDLSWIRYQNRIKHPPQ